MRSHKSHVHWRRQDHISTNARTHEHWCLMHFIRTAASSRIEWDWVGNENRKKRKKKKPTRRHILHYYIHMAAVFTIPTAVLLGYSDHTDDEMKQKQNVSPYTKRHQQVRWTHCWFFCVLHFSVSPSFCRFFSCFFFGFLDAWYFISK